MGFYIEVCVLTNGSRQPKVCIQNEKGGLGNAIFLFQPQDFSLERRTGTYTCETTVEEALKNLAILDKMLDEREASSDDWSANAISIYGEAFSKYKQILSLFDGNDIVYSDMSEGMLSFSENDIDNFQTDDDYRNALKFFTDVVSGNYNGYYCGKKHRHLAERFMTDIKRELRLVVDNFKELQQDYNWINLSKMGDVKILETKANLIFQRDTEDKGEDWFYSSTNYLLPIFTYLQKKNIHMRELFEPVFNLKPDERRFKVSFQFDVSNL